MIYKVESVEVYELTLLIHVFLLIQASLLHNTQKVEPDNSFK